MWFKRKKIKLLRELAKIVDKDIKVKKGKKDLYDGNLCADVDNKVIHLSFYDEFACFGQNIMPYLLIDMGWKYHNYCSMYLFGFLHELGHIVNGNILPPDMYDMMIREAVSNKHDYVTSFELYHKVPDEYWAMEWAYEFVKKNKAYVRRLSKELENAV